MQRFVLLIALVAIASGCSFLETSEDQPIGTTSTVADVPATTVAQIPQGSAADAPPCLAGDRPFSDSGVISAFGRLGGDATQISGVRWAPHEGCERVVIDLLTADGAPAGAIDPVGVDYRTPEGVIRISLPPAVAKSAIADSLIDGGLVERAYVVDTRDGHLAIDLHIRPGISVELRAFELTSPSRVVVDVRSAEEAAEVVGVATASGIVLLSPLPATSGTDIVVSGYARGPGDEVTVRVFEGTDALTAEKSTSLRGDSTMWREFELSITDLPERRLQLNAGVTGAGVRSTVQVEFDASRSDPPGSPEL